MELLKKIKKLLILAGDFLGTIMSTILLTLIYFVIIGPTSLIAHLLHKDFLSLKKTGSSYWTILEEKNINSSADLQLPF